MAWAQFQKAEDTAYEDYERVNEAIGVDDNPPDGLIVHAAGEVDGRWLLVDIWESQAAFEKFRDERLMPAVVQVLGQEAVDAGPPPTESFEVKHMVKP
jgi:hypothetical protein